jgi:membrane protein DedA with SNARE-associated domain
VLYQISTRPKRLLWAACLIGLLAVGTTAALAEQGAKHAVDVAATDIGHDLEDAVRRMQPLVERYGYAGVAGAVSVEGFGVPAPGQTFLMAGALEAAHGKLNLVLVLVIAVAAAVLGNSLGYLIGKRGGRPLLRKLHVNEDHEAKLTALFDRFGGGFILLARFFDGPRQLNGILAGTLGMPWWLFTIFNVIGAMLWVAVWGLGTFYLTKHLHSVDAVLRAVNPWVAGLAVAGVLAILLYLFRGRRGQGSAADRPRR